MLCLLSDVVVVSPQAPRVSVEDMAIAAASLKDGRPPRERLALPLSTITQDKADVSRVPNRFDAEQTVLCLANPDENRLTSKLKGLNRRCKL